MEEWLNRQGYFTIRGIKVGVHEMDLLAIRITATGLECRHLEVQASMRPVSYITRVPLAVQKATGRSATSSKTRVDDELREGVREWIAKKFDHEAKRSRCRDRRMHPARRARLAILSRPLYSEAMRIEPTQPQGPGNRDQFASGTGYF
jgi:hypothetical protein